MSVALKQCESRNGEMELIILRIIKATVTYELFMRMLFSKIFRKRQAYHPFRKAKHVQGDLAVDPAKPRKSP